MIGVIPKPSQKAAVEEFFELFKVPWEFYREGQTYDVVVATADAIPEVSATLLIVYGSEAKSVDLSNGITVRSRHGGGLLDCPNLALPIYGRLAVFAPGSSGIPCVAAPVGIAGLRIAPTAGGAVLLRLGYDLFQEAQLLFSGGQPIDQAHIPTLDIHISMLRNWILSEGIPVLEVPPAPPDHGFAVCLTHDIDFVGIRDHKFDHTMWGFLYRSTLGSVRKLFERRISIRRLFDNWRAAASLPLVHLGWAKDFWEPFGWYLDAEKGLPATYFLIPFKRRAGERVPGPHADRRATAYDVGDLADWTATLKREGCELGVHGIDAWHSVEKGHAELARIAATTGESSIGIRMHWLLHDAGTASTLEESGYAYDCTLGYNETIGYRNGTTQVFRPLGAKALMELPLHIQDGALFYPQRLNLTEPEAEKSCGKLMDHARRFGGVLTVLWHDRSHAPERFWGDFYIRLVQTLKSSGGWFATTGQAVGWFRKRRHVRFERTGDACGVRSIFPDEAEMALPSLCLRVYRPSLPGSNKRLTGDMKHTFIDIPCHAGDVVEFDSLLNPVFQVPVESAIQN